MLMIAAPLLALALAAPAVAQEPGSRATREFVQAAGLSDAFELVEAQAVLTQSTDARVRGFAERMLRDHGETGRMLRQATARSGIAPPPMGIGDDQARLLGGLQGLNGRAFDEAYVRQQALAHRSALTVEQRYAAGGDDPALRQAAASAIPTISAHLAEIERLRTALGGP